MLKAMAVHLKNPFTWFYGLVNAFITGGCGAVGLMTYDPKTFNVHEGLNNLVSAFIAIGVTNAISYLRKSPLPELVETSTYTKETFKTSTPTETTQSTIVTPNENPKP